MASIPLAFTYIPLGGRIYLGEHFDLVRQVQGGSIRGFSMAAYGAQPCHCLSGCRSALASANLVAEGTVGGIIVHNIATISQREVNCSASIE